MRSVLKQESVTTRWPPQTHIQIIKKKKKEKPIDVTHDHTSGKQQSVKGKKNEELHTYTQSVRIRVQNRTFLRTSDRKARIR